MVEESLVREIVRRITGVLKPRRIIIFGSAARGQMKKGSDLDILVVMPDGTHRREASISAYLSLNGLGISKDVVVVTERDIKDHGENPSLVIQPALKEGVEVYGAR